ncbi:MAG TPA: regulatory protein RecX [Actinophytocola sp.]|uniref:regulatory protein RecX n=1 Tax=Actinophytocola sp. TaxID=1872138 RepID=UPI002DDD78E7|nr:regulatory protein RecX [Actinophytocola sp.]HEV2782983.1 regulatory protein RecX [Actinophytocola sp.]
MADAPNVEDPVQRAKDICLRLLTVRPRTRAELQQALARKGIDGEVIEGVLGRLDAIGLVDDRSFAEVWVRSRHTYEGLGRRALAAELRRKGVEESVTAEAVAAIDYGAEEERARQLVRKKLRTLGGADDAVRVRRLVGMLARKGYSQGMSFRVVRDELRSADADTDLLDDAPLD